MLLIYNKYNKNVSYLLRLRLLRYRQTPNYPKRVKAHAERREPSTLLLIVFLKFGEFQKTRIKADASQYVYYVICYVTIRSFVLRVRPYITFANIGINLQTCKKTREKLPKCLELSKILRIFAPSKVTFGYPGKFPERASRIRHYPF